MFLCMFQICIHVCFEKVNNSLEKFKSQIDYFQGTLTKLVEQ